MPTEIEVDDIKKDFLKIKNVKMVRDLHVWVISGGKNVLTAHLYLDKLDNDINHRYEIHRVCHEAEIKAKKYNICHVTL